MTRITRTDHAVMCNIINIHTHTLPCEKRQSHVRASKNTSENRVILQAACEVSVT